MQMPTGRECRVVTILTPFTLSVSIPYQVRECTEGDDWNINHSTNRTEIDERTAKKAARTGRAVCEEVSSVVLAVNEWASRRANTAEQNETCPGPVWT